MKTSINGHEGSVLSLLQGPQKNQLGWRNHSFKHFNADWTHSQFPPRKLCFFQHLQYFRLDCKLKAKKIYVSWHRKNKYYPSQSLTSLSNKYTILCLNASHWLHLTFCLYRLKKFWSVLKPYFLDRWSVSPVPHLGLGKQLPLLG